MGAALKPTQGSCLPLTCNSTSSFSLLTVVVFWEMLDVGFSDTYRSISSPLEMPPIIPPELFERNPALAIRSLFAEPFISTTLVPAPISTAFTALTLIIAFASSASSFENTGDPTPGFRPATLTKIFAPTESCSLLRAWKKVSSSLIFSKSTKLNSFLTASEKDTLLALISPICTTPAEMLIPSVVKIFFAIAPPATRIAVSRALALPPPR